MQHNFYNNNCYLTGVHDNHHPHRCTAFSWKGVRSTELDKYINAYIEKNHISKCPINPLENHSSNNVSLFSQQQLLKIYSYKYIYTQTRFNEIINNLDTSHIWSDRYHLNCYYYGKLFYDHGYWNTAVPQLFNAPITSLNGKPLKYASFQEIEIYCWFVQCFIMGCTISTDQITKILINNKKFALKNLLRVLAEIIYAFDLKLCDTPEEQTEFLLSNGIVMENMDPTKLSQKSFNTLVQCRSCSLIRNLPGVYTQQNFDLFINAYFMYVSSVSYSKHVIDNDFKDVLFIFGSFLNNKCTLTSNQLGMVFYSDYANDNYVTLDTTIRQLYMNPETYINKLCEIFYSNDVIFNKEIILHIIEKYKVLIKHTSKYGVEPTDPDIINACYCNGVKGSNKKTAINNGTLEYALKHDTTTSTLKKIAKTVPITIEHLYIALKYKVSTPVLSFIKNEIKKI